MGVRKKCGLAEVKTDTRGEGLYSRFCEGSCSSTVNTGEIWGLGEKYKKDFFSCMSLVTYAIMKVIF